MDLYPPINAYDTQMIPVGQGHHLYVEQSGNPRGVPVLFIHGGPGAGTAPVFRRFFDPEFYRIVLVDQRGCGQSLPFASTNDNTTAHLVADFEIIRQRLDIKSWLLFGGSWGSTLALAYGQAHPSRVLGFILRGVFLFRAREVDWFLYGMGRFHPEAFARFVAQAGGVDDLLTRYHRQLFNPEPKIHIPAALAWAKYEESCARLIPRPEPADDIKGAITISRMECHYMINQGFLAENQLLDQIKTITDKPAIIIQGRHDLVCPPESAWELAQNWPRCQLRLIAEGGHSSMEGPIRRALVTATIEMQKHLRHQ